MPGNSSYQVIKSNSLDSGMLQAHTKLPTPLQTCKSIKGSKCKVFNDVITNSSEKDSYLSRFQNWPMVQLCSGFRIARGSTPSNRWPLSVTDITI